MTIDAYPLQWPVGWPRTPDHRRNQGRFGVTVTTQRESGSIWTTKKALTIADGLERVTSELEKLGVIDRQNVVISSNVALRNNGMPRSSTRQPDDPGVAVYWILDGERQCMAIDAYRRLADNLAAVAATIGAMRMIERHGGAQILKRAFHGFKALPESTDTATTTEQAWEILARFAGSELARDRHNVVHYIRYARNKTHPDKGGDVHDFHAVERAADVLTLFYGITA